MNPRLEGWSIVLAGHWNRMIFTPQWVGRELFHAEQIDTMVAILPVFPIIYSDKHVRVEVSEPRIAFFPKDEGDDCLQRAETMALTVLERLKDTPLLGVGVNFAFDEPHPPQELLDVFRLSDNSAIAQADWEIREKKITRQLCRDRCILNLIVGYNQEKVSFDFNFHAETTENVPAKEAVNGRIVELHETALQVLDDVYHLRPTNREEDHE